MSPPFIVAVTGANRGLGLAILTLLTNSPPITPLTIIACAREPPAETLVDSKSPDVKVDWHQLDVTSSSSISSLTSDIKESYPDGIDILINNAGVNLDTDNEPGPDISKQTLNVNYFGTVNLTTSLLPLIFKKPSSRVVIVSSTGSLNLSREKKQELSSLNSFPEIQSQIDAYLSAVSASDEEARHWPRGLSYSVSKAMLNVATKLWSEEYAGKVLFNCCCPGWCATDTGKLTGPAPKSPEDGAKLILNLAVGDIGGTTGKYWANAQVTDKGLGAPVDWTR